MGRNNRVYDLEKLYSNRRFSTFLDNNGFFNFSFYAHPSVGKFKELSKVAATKAKTIRCVIENSQMYPIFTKSLKELASVRISINRLDIAARRPTVQVFSLSEYPIDSSAEIPLNELQDMEVIKNGEITEFITSGRHSNVRPLRQEAINNVDIILKLSEYLE